MRLTELELARPLVPGLPRSTANPPTPGPGIAPGNVERTAIQQDPGSIGGGTIERPERYLLVVRHEPQVTAAAGDAPRFLFVRWPDWPHPALLSFTPPMPEEGLEHAVRSLLASRMGVQPSSEPQLVALQVPARMPHPRTGVEGLGWLRPVIVTASGAPTPDALLADVASLTRGEALATLSTEVERVIFGAGAELLG